MMESCWDLLLGLLRFPYFNYVPHLEAWFSILPEGNCLPSTYKEAYRVNQPNLVSELVLPTKMTVLCLGENLKTVCPALSATNCAVKQGKPMFHKEYFIIYLLGHVYLEVLVLKVYLTSKVMEGVPINRNGRNREWHSWFTNVERAFPWGWFISWESTRHCSVFVP